jgi:hypothetical protein
MAQGGQVMILIPTMDKLKETEADMPTADERLYEAALDYEETLSADKLFDFVAELVGSLGSFLTLRR